MKQILVALFVFFTIGCVNGQMNASIDILGGLNSTFRSIDGNGSNTEMVRNDLELNKGNLHIGFNFNKLISSKLFFKTGVRYLSMGYKTKDQVLTFPDMSSTTIYFTYDYQFIEIPIIFRYEMVSEKALIPFIELGINPMYLFGNIQVQYQDEEDSVSMRNPINADFNKIHFAINAGIGVNYFLSGGNTCLFIQGLYRYDLTNLVSDDNFKEYLYGYGFEVGVRRSVASDY